MMTARDAMRLALCSGLRFELDDGVVVLVGDDDVIDELYETLQPYRLGIRALIEEYGAKSATDAVAAAARVLRGGCSPSSGPASRSSTRRPKTPRN